MSRVWVKYDDPMLADNKRFALVDCDVNDLRQVRLDIIKFHTLFYSSRNFDITFLSNMVIELNVTPDADVISSILLAHRSKAKYHHSVVRVMEKEWQKYYPNL